MEADATVPLQKCARCYEESFAFLQCYELLCKGAIWILSFRVCDADVAPPTVQCCCCVCGAQLELGLECAGGELGTKNGARTGAGSGECGAGGQLCLDLLHC